MDVRVTKSVRMEPKRWQTVMDLQQSKRLPSMGAALDEIIDWWETSRRLREPDPKRKAKP